MNKRTLSNPIKTLRAKKLTEKLIIRRGADLSAETASELDTYVERLTDAHMEGFDTIDLEDFVAELTDILVDGQ